MKNEQVTQLIDQEKRWKSEMTALRSILLSCKLTEVFKWKQACYMYEDTNLFIIGAFKENCVLSIFNGALLNDHYRLLEIPGPNTQAARMIKFKNLSEIKSKKEAIIFYIKESIKAKQEGKKVDFKKDHTDSIPKELIEIFKQIPALKKAFNSLTPGKQRGYILYFTGAKQSATITSRILKYKDKILLGKGMMDYK